MIFQLRRLVVLACALAVWSLFPRAQMRVAPIDDDQGHVALGLVLRHLGNTGTFMMATAHPDDEDNGLYVMLNRGQGYRTTLATATRGNGGQNEIGPEIFEALGVLRTEELAALHRFDGAEQYFTRAVDFGFSFSIDETLEKWGRDEITSDYVHLIRMIRPDVITAMSPNATGGGLHHATSATLSHDAFKMAGDPSKYPDQIKDGLRPWQPRKFYYRAALGGGANQPPPTGRVTRCDLALFDSLLGKTYSEIGTEARSMHKCQGQAQLLALPGPANSVYQLADSTIPGAMDRDERSLFDGIDTTVPGLAKLAGARAPKDLVDGLNAIAVHVQTAQKNYDSVNDEATLQPLVAGLRSVRVLRGQLRSMALDEGARFEIETRLRQKEREFQQASLIANEVRIEALADDGLVVPGQAVKIAVIVANHGGADITVKQVKFDGFDGDAACALTPVVAARARRRPRPRGRRACGAGHDHVQEGSGRALRAVAQDSGNARVTEPYWHREGDAGRYTFDADAPFGLPYRPTPFYVQVTWRFPGGEDVIAGLPIQHRYEGNIFSGEKRTELLVVPALSVRVSPEIVIIPAAMVRPASAPAKGAPPSARLRAPQPPPVAASREIRVTVVNDTPGATESVVTLNLPQGWTATPAQQSRDVRAAGRIADRPFPDQARAEHAAG